MAHRCPPWVGVLLLNPFRRLGENPRRLLGSLLRPCMTVLEPGPGMGFFTLDIARLVGPTGRVVAVDVEPAMIERLRRRAEAAGVADRVEVRLASSSRLGIEDLVGGVDVAIAIHVVHEIDDKATFFADIRAALKPDGRVLVVEPPLHVSRAAFAVSLEIARRAGLRVAGRPRLAWRKEALLVRE